MAFVPSVISLRGDRRSQLTSHKPSSQWLSPFGKRSPTHSVGGSTFLPAIGNGTSDRMAVNAGNTVTMAMGEEVYIKTSDPAAVTAEKLVPFYMEDTVKFKSILAQVQFEGCPTRPKFPPVSVADVVPVPDSEVEAFKAYHIDNTYLKWGTPEAEERINNDRKLQFARWRWACENVQTFVNVLRCAGFGDENIQNMFDGTPLCFRSVGAYAELRAALATLKGEIEAEVGWQNVSFIITGSSVPGFSQNPCKGVADRPTKITSATGSDVDISICAMGVNDTMLERKRRGEEEPRRLYDTTCTETTSAVRFGCGDISAVCESAAAFCKLWDEKLDGGLQLTFSDYSNVIPPWESRIDIEQI